MSRKQRFGLAVAMFGMLFSILSAILPDSPHWFSFIVGGVFGMGLVWLVDATRQ